MRVVVQRDDLLYRMLLIIMIIKNINITTIIILLRINFSAKQYISAGNDLYIHVD